MAAPAVELVQSFEGTETF